MQSSDGGATFGPAVRLEGPDSDFWIPSLDVAIDSKGTGFVCYAKSTSPGQTARLAVAPAGQAFGAPGTSRREAIFSTSLSLGSDGVVYVAYMDDSELQLLASLRRRIVLRRSGRLVRNDTHASTHPSSFRTAGTASRWLERG